LFLGCAHSFSPAEEPEKCLSQSQIAFTALLPGGKIDMSQPSVFQKPSTEKSIQSYGVFVDSHSVLTVSHAVPKNSELSGFSVIRSNEEQELLLLSSKQCGKPLIVSEQELKVGTEVFFCDEAKPAGVITQIELTSYSKLPLSSSTKPLSGIALVDGSFSLGDSGKGFCYADGALAGILVATDQNGNGLLIPSQTILGFLN
jgi:hypothetical protein